MQLPASIASVVATGSLSYGFVDMFEPHTFYLAGSIAATGTALAGVTAGSAALKSGLCWVKGRGPTSPWSDIS